MLLFVKIIYFLSPILHIHMSNIAASYVMEQGLII